MTPSELLKNVMDRRFLLAVEVRGTRVEPTKFVDKKTGLARGRVQITYVVERILRSGMDVIKIIQRLPETITSAEQVEITTIKGNRYVFELERMQYENGMVSAWTRYEPEPLDDLKPGLDGGLPLAGASQPAASASNLVLLQTTPQEAE